MDFHFNFDLIICSLVGQEDYVMPLFLGINYKGPLPEILQSQNGMQLLKTNLASQHQISQWMVEALSSARECHFTSSSAYNHFYDSWCLVSKNNFCFYFLFSLLITKMPLCFHFVSCF